MTLLRTFGRLALDGTDLTRPQPLLVLAYLHVEGPVSREHAARLFWPNVDRGRKNLSMALVRLRGASEDAVDETDDRLSSNVACDATRFVEAFQAGDHEGALEWYEGPFLPDAPGSSGGPELEEWVLTRRESFARYACRANVSVGIRAMERGDVAAAARSGRAALHLVHDHAIFDAEILERVHRLLRWVESPDVEEVRRLLREFELDLPAERQVRVVGAPRVQLVGREHDVDRVEAALTENQGSLVTITGPAGVGKTSLAFEVAHRVAAADRFRDGVRSVSLESVRASAEVVGRLAKALGVADASDVITAIRASLRDRDMLVVVDNFEHVMDAASDLADITAALSGPSFLVTSRSRLQLRDEREIVLDPLDTATRNGSPSAAAELFVKRARQSSPGFNPSPTDLRIVEDICQRLDGIPLAIELAAVHAKAFGLRDIRAMLDDRLELLRGGYRDAHDRQRSLVAAIDWSYQLLTDAEQRAFRRLAVFRGSFDLAGVEAVAGLTRSEAATHVTTLVKHHLVKPSSSAGVTRFRSLESVRAYASRRLAQAAEATEAERAHARRLAEIAESADATDDQHGLDDARHGLALEADNLRGALDWCRDEGDVGLGRRLIRHTWRFWLERGDLREARAWLEAFAPSVSGSDEIPAGAAAGDDTDLQRALCTVLHELGEFALARRDLEALKGSLTPGDPRLPRIDIDLAWVLAHMGELGRAERVARGAESAIDADLEPRVAALVENNVGWIALYRGDVASARRRFARSLELRTMAADERGRWFAAVNLAWSAAGGTGALGGPGTSLATVPRASDSALSAALERCARARDALRLREDAQLTAWADTVFAELAVAAGRAEEVEPSLMDVVAAWRRVGNADGLALAFEALAGARLALGDYAGAEVVARDALQIRDRCGNLWGTARARIQLGLAGLGIGAEEPASQWFRRALEASTELGHRWFPAACREALDRMPAARTSAGEQGPGA